MYDETLTDTENIEAASSTYCEVDTQIACWLTIDMLLSLKLLITPDVTDAD